LFLLLVILLVLILFLRRFRGSKEHEDTDNVDQEGPTYFLWSRIVFPLDPRAQDTPSGTNFEI
jgi:hypothetical protein